MLLIPRPELSSAFVEVDEFRIRAHDGLRLYGLRAQSRIGGGTGPARVRIVGPSDLPAIDCRAIVSGQCEYVFQEPAGRKLEDRVMDVLRICQLASDSGAECARGVRLTYDEGAEPDEFMIASRILDNDPEMARVQPLDDAAGWSTLQ